MRPLRFLIITADTFPPFRVDVSVLFGQVFAGRGHKLEWVMQAEAGDTAAGSTTWEGGVVHVGATTDGESRGQRLKKHILGIANDLRALWSVRAGEYDVIQVRDKFISAVFGLYVAKRRGARFVYWLSYPFPEDSLYMAGHGGRYPVFYWLRGTLFKYLLYWVILPRADHAFVQSEKMKSDLVRNGASEKKLTPVPMGVSVEMMSAADVGGLGGRDEGMGASIVYIGTLQRIRRLDFLVRVLRRVRERVPDAVLYLVGGSDNEDDIASLRAEAKREGVSEAVVITGFIPQGDAWEYVRRADVCVSPFAPNPVLDSTSPTKLVEYLALGKVAVANDHPDQRMVIDESGGGLCVGYDVSEFSDAVVYLLQRPEVAREMGQRGRDWVIENRDYHKLGEMIERKYYEVVATAGDARDQGGLRGEGTE